MNKARMRMLQIALVAVLVTGLAMQGTAPASATATGLTWEPPTLSNPITIYVSSTNRDIRLDATKDYRLVMTEPVAAVGGLVISGGRNVVMIGGEIRTLPKAQAPGEGDRRGLFLKNQTGTIHIEGLKITGPDLSEGINLDQRNGATVQFQNIVIDQVNGSQAGNHADLIQSWSGPKMLRIDGLRGTTTYQGFFLLANQYPSGATDTWDIRNVDITGNAGSGYFLWKNSEQRVNVSNINLSRPNGDGSKLAWPNVSAWGSLNNARATTDVIKGAPGFGYVSPGYGDLTPPPTTVPPTTVPPTTVPPTTVPPTTVPPTTVPPTTVPPTTVPPTTVPPTTVPPTTVPPIVQLPSIDPVWTMSSGVAKTTALVTVNGTFSAPSSLSGYYVHNLEIWNAQYKKVFQKTTKSTLLNGGSTMVTLSVPVSEFTPGKYFVRQGVWSGDWSDKQDGLDQTNSFTISTADIAASAVGGGSSNEPAPASTPPRADARSGYWMVAADGGVFSMGAAQFHGSTGNLKLNQPVVTLASTSSGDGYWLVARDGGIFSFGDAAFHGSTGALKLNQPIVGMAATPSGNGYWLVASDGGIFAFGDAQFFGSTGALHLNKPVVGMAATPSGNGYWLVASDGGIFAFGDAAFYGSTGAINLNQPIVAMSTTATGRGYRFVAADGGVFNFGDAPFQGSAVGQINGTAAGLQATPSGNGYWITSTSGWVGAYGDANNEGSLNGPLNAAVVGTAALTR